MKRRKSMTNLRERRTNRGLSQSELAKLANVNYRTLQDYEQGSKDINRIAAITLYRIAKALDCKIEDLLEL